MDIDKTLTRVEELWFFDSGLIVQAEQSLYRVSGGILAARSPIFKDMLSFTQPPDAETIDGCPVVRLPDRAADVTCFFRAIFDSSFFEPHPRLVNLHHVLSILHLSNKYSIEYLLRRAMVHLSSLYPTTLAEYDEGGFSSLLDLEEEDILPSRIATIQVAREVNALWILPSASYEIASIDEAIVDKTLQCVWYKDRPARLSDGDQILFLKSSMRISRQENFILASINPPNVIHGCLREVTCTLERLRTLTDVQNSLTENCEALRLLHQLGDLLDGCCQVCIDHLETALAEARQAVWDKLPGFCGLPSWDVLEEMKEKAFEED
ncbi:hypothetical protein B0H16DRAFT_396799 [Mycena metata]|uniref:BTB domain-containing protein n=1 Tax=Mycena metata TaxID=1033252 RepID=A0AAD7NLC6_9AGAR|nr:hypothetical protein B0H16DRAFT_396799 [Mycena metata]